MRKLLILAILLAGCTTTGGTFCTIAKPQRYSEAVIAAMSDAEVEKTLAHNEKGEKLCGWTQ